MGGNSNRVMAGWFQHSESLRAIEFFLTYSIGSSTLRRIPITFRALERLIIKDDHTSQFKLALEDAVAEPWAFDQI